jgi:hypothetical protein
VDKEDAIGIFMIYGYDIGISSAWRSQNFVFSPEQKGESDFLDLSGQNSTPLRNFRVVVYGEPTLCLVRY